MAAENWLGINLGDIIGQTEQIKNAQQTRAYNAIKIQQAQQERADELAKRDAYRQLFTPPTPTAGDVTGSAPAGYTGYNPAGLAALGSVDPEAAFKVREHLAKLSADQRELEGKKYTALGPLVLRAQKMPYEARKSFITAAAPYLQAQGFTPQEIMSFDPTDQNIQALGTAAMTVPQVLDSMKIEWHQQGEQPSFATDSMGNLVNPQAVMGSPANLPHINSPQEAQRLPPGSKFIAPDGSIRTVPGGAGPQGPRTFP